jgi:hypothetical protein
MVISIPDMSCHSALVKDEFGNAPRLGRDEAGEDNQGGGEDASIPFIES